MPSLKSSGKLHPQSLKMPLGLSTIYIFALENCSWCFRCLFVFWLWPRLGCIQYKQVTWDSDNLFGASLHARLFQSSLSFAVIFQDSKLLRAITKIVEDWIKTKMVSPLSDIIRCQEIVKRKRVYHSRYQKSHEGYEIANHVTRMLATWAVRGALHVLSFSKNSNSHERTGYHTFRNKANTKDELSLFIFSLLYQITWYVC